MNKLSDVETETAPKMEDSKSESREKPVGGKTADDETAATYNKFDVLLGRGRAFQLYPGNRRFQALIGANAERYATSTVQAGKWKITMEIVEAVMEKGRFLKPSKVHGWTVIALETARQKVAHALQYHKRRCKNQIAKEQKQLAKELEAARRCASPKSTDGGSDERYGAVGTDMMYELDRPVLVSPRGVIPSMLSLDAHDMERHGMVPMYAPLECSEREKVTYVTYDTHRPYMLVRRAPSGSRVVSCDALPPLARSRYCATPARVYEGTVSTASDHGWTGSSTDPTATALLEEIGYDYEDPDWDMSYQESMTDASQHHEAIADPSPSTPPKTLKFFPIETTATPVPEHQRSEQSASSVSLDLYDIINDEFHHEQRVQGERPGSNVVSPSNGALDDFPSNEHDEYYVW